MQLNPIEASLFSEDCSPSEVFNDFLNFRDSEFVWHRIYFIWCKTFVMNLHSWWSDWQFSSYLTWESCSSRMPNLQHDQSTFSMDCIGDSFPSLSLGFSENTTRSCAKTNIRFMVMFMFLCWLDWKNNFQSITYLGSNLKEDWFNCILLEWGQMKLFKSSAQPWDH